MIIKRITKNFRGTEDYLSVDLKLVTDEIRSFWKSKENAMSSSVEILGRDENLKNAMSRNWESND